MSENVEQVVLVELIEPHVALVTINRPEARNAIDASVASALEAARLMLEADDGVWTIILTGAGGKAFSAGADLRSVADVGFASLYTREGGFAGFAAASRVKPWIAAVEGYALAGGCELALACDLVVAGDGALFGLPEVSRGLIAAAGGLYRLPRAMPPSLANELVLTAGRISAERAAQVGLVNYVVERGGAIRRATELAQAICANAPLAVRESLRIMRAASRTGEQELQQMSTDAQARLSETQDFAEGPRAFIEKRAPNWRGR